MSDLAFPESLPAFQRLFPDDAACATYLERIRWPETFVCPKCKASGEPFRFAARPGVLRCRKCKKDTALTSGSVMERTHTPLSTWFWAAYLVSSLTSGISAVQFQRQLGINSYETAFQVLHKLRAGMVRPDRDKLGGQYPVELDETYVGGRTRGEGKGVHHKTLVIGAVEVRKRQTPGPLFEASKAIPRRGGKYAGRLRLSVAPDRKANTLIGFTRRYIERKSDVTTDDWSGYDRLSSACGVNHTQVPERGDPAVVEKHLPLIHLVFSNLKAWLIGCHHGVSPQHLQAYLNEFTFRFNRRFYPFNAFRSLLGIGGAHAGPTYADLYSGEWQHPSTTTGSVHG